MGGGGGGQIWPKSYLAFYKRFKERPLEINDDNRIVIHFRRLLPENDNVTIHTLKSCMLLKAHGV